MPPKIVVLTNTGFVGKTIFEEFKNSGAPGLFGYSSSVVNLLDPPTFQILNSVLDDQTTFVLTAGITRDRADTPDTFRANLSMVTNLIHFLEDRRLARLVFISSTSVYGDGAQELDVSHARALDPQKLMRVSETSKVDPTCYYGIAKVAGELLLRKTAMTAGYPLLILRVCRLYGPGDTHRIYGPAEFIADAVEKKRVRLFGDGREVRDYLYIGDCVRLVRRLIEQGSSGVYNLVSGQSHSFIEILDHLRALLPAPFEVERMERTRPSIDQTFDNRKLINAVPGFEFTSFREGLRLAGEPVLSRSQVSS